MINFHILNNPGLYNDYEHQIDFSNLQAQTEYWNTQIIQTFDEFKINFVNDNKIRINGNYNSLRNATYCCANILINGDLKRHYYFITNLRVGATYNPDELEQLIELDIEEDVYQTYMFDFEIKESFVEREHQDRLKVDKKRVFSHTPEPVYTSGELKHETVISHFSSDNVSGLKFLVLQFSQKPVLKDTPNVFSSLTSCIIPFLEGNPTAQIIPAIGTETDHTRFFTFEEIITKGLDDSNVISANVINYLKHTAIEPGENNNEFLYVGSSLSYTLGQVEFDSGSGKTGFYSVLFPKDDLSFNLVFFDNINLFSVSNLPNIENEPNLMYESKLLTAPYTKGLLKLNKTGNFYDLSYLTNLHVDYIPNVYGVVSENFSPITLLNYSSLNFSSYVSSVSESEIPLEKNEWEIYIQNNKNSLRAQQLKQEVGLGASVAGAIGSALTGNVVGLVGSLVGVTNSYLNMYSNIANLQDIKNRHSESINTGTEYYLIRGQKLGYMRWFIHSLPDEEKNRVFKFFMLYGYANNSNKIPDLKSRYYYNYIKMQANIGANLNVNIINKLKSIFNNGITLWHYRDASTFLFNDYSKENAEMSLIGAN